MNKPTNNPISAWTRGASRVLAKTRILELHGVMYSHPSRKAETEFSVIHTSDWVNVIATTPDRQLVLVKQFRYGIGAPSLEIPGGIIEEGEEPIQAGLRELQEETGFVGTHARVLGRVHPNPAIQNNRCYLVWVENVVRQSDVAWDEHEELEVITLPVDQAYALAHSGDITHSLVLNGLLLFMPHWLSMKAP